MPGIASGNSQPDDHRSRWIEDREIIDELRRVARLLMRHERVGHTLAPTELVNESLLRTMGLDKLEEISVDEFLIIVVGTMRRVLVDHARRRNAIKRGGDLHRTSFDSAIHSGQLDPRIQDVDLALKYLTGVSPRQARVVELKFFGGLTMVEIAKALGVSKRTADGDWAYARAWLFRELSPA